MAKGEYRANSKSPSMALSPIRLRPFTSRGRRKKTMLLPEKEGTGNVRGFCCWVDVSSSVSSFLALPFLAPLPVPNSLTSPNPAGASSPCSSPSTCNSFLAPLCPSSLASLTHLPSSPFLSVIQIKKKRSSLLVGPNLGSIIGLNLRLLPPSQGRSGS